MKYLFLLIFIGFIVSCAKPVDHPVTIEITFLSGFKDTLTLNHVASACGNGKTPLIYLNKGDLSYDNIEDDPIGRVKTIASSVQYYKIIN